MSKVWLYCNQHSLCYNNMWAAGMYMFVFLRKQRLCIINEKLNVLRHRNKAMKHLQNICSQDFWELDVVDESFCYKTVSKSSCTQTQKTMYWFNFCKICFVLQRLYVREWQWPWIFSDSLLREKRPPIVGHQCNCDWQKEWMWGE